MDGPDWLIHSYDSMNLRLGLYGKVDMRASDWFFG
jgi:hypothetical protein